METENIDNNLNQNKDFLEIKLISSWLKKPMLIIGGLWDPHLEGALDLYQKSKAAGGNPEIIIGNATHLNWWEGSQNTLLDLFDTHLKKNKEVNKKTLSDFIEKLPVSNNVKEELKSISPHNYLGNSLK